MLTVPHMTADEKIQVSSHGYKYGVKHFFNTKTQPLVDCISTTLQMTAGEVLGLLNLGAIYVNGSRQGLTSNTESKNGDLIRVHTTPRRYQISYNWKNRIVFEHRDFLILNKPANLPSHPSVDNLIENALTQTSQALGIPLYISHRLDSLTEGLIVYGKTKEFVTSFNGLLAQGAIEKHYVALTHDGPNLVAKGNSKLVHFMKPDPRAPKEVSNVHHPEWLMCELEILAQKRIQPEQWHIEINLLTGRTHQIRSQLAFEGLPILGDKMYGSTIEFFRSSDIQENLNPIEDAQIPQAQIALRAQYLRFTYDSEQFEFQISKDF